jgi:hypothetical protein
VRDLGGKDLMRGASAHALTDSAVSHRGYFYFGAARDLPGVAELLTGGKARRENSDDLGTDCWDEDDRTPIDELLTRIGAMDGYYGVKDDALAELETRRENKDRAALITSWENVKENSLLDDEPVWDAEAITARAGQAPLAGQDFELALTAIDLARSKLQLLERVGQAPD